MKIRRPLILVLTAAVAACAPAGPSAGGPEESGPRGPRLAAGSLSRAGEAEAAELLETARQALEQGRNSEAESSLTRIIEGYPSSAVSVDALALRARLRTEEAVTAAAEAGEERPPLVATRAEQARRDLERLLAVVPSDDPRVVPARLDQSRVLELLGDDGAALLASLSLPPDATIPPEEVARVRELAAGLGSEALGGILTRSDAGQPLRIPVLVAYARALRIAGEEDEARRYARSALDAGATGRDADIATALVEGRGLPRAGDGPVPVGVVLPLGGSPTFQRFARELQEGMETAVHAWGLDEDVELLVLDDGGDVPTAANLVRTAESRGAVAILGLLEDATVMAAEQARTDVPLVSPTAYAVPESEEPVLTLNGFDPGAAEALAGWAAESGIRQVAVIHAAGGASLDEARLFREAFEALGGSVLRQLSYPPGITFWQEQILAAAQLEPEAIVLPVPPDDVPGIAPQLTFFGVDTLGIRILGTGGWTDPVVLEEVDIRHTRGVVSATPIRPGSDDPGYRRFREAYEDLYRRGLVDGSVRALGYDAASLVLQGIFAGAGAPGEVADALGQLKDLPGATGLLSVVDGSIRRAHEVVCIAPEGLQPIRPGLLPVQQYRPWEPDEETGMVPEGPGRPDGYVCPDPMAPEADSMGVAGESPADTLRPDTSRLLSPVFPSSR